MAAGCAGPQGRGPGQETRAEDRERAGMGGRGARLKWWGTFEVGGPSVQDGLDGLEGEGGVEVGGPSWGGRRKGEGGAGEMGADGRLPRLRHCVTHDTSVTLTFQASNTQCLISRKRSSLCG